MKKRKTDINIFEIRKLIYLLFIISAAAFFFQGSPAQAENSSAKLSHDSTNFPLKGKHRDAECSECHLKGVIQNTPSNCEACHWERKRDDRYNLQLGYHCNECHNPFDWKKLNMNAWDHFQQTGFALKGIHKTLDCFSCHKGKFRAGNRNDCIDCHREDFEEVSDPNHKINSFPTDCTICHKSMVSWEGAKYFHANNPLTGAHLTLDCSECHKDGNFTPLSSECISCHREDYNNAKDPNHLKGNYSLNCMTCHRSMSNWHDASFAHDNFPLLGAHKALDCSDCHKNGIYTGLSKECYSCHKSDYDKTTNPNHKTTGFPTTCDSCHYNTHTSWGQAVFLHQFPITSGKHSGFACSDCHITSNYNEFSCIDCHAHEKSTMDNKHKEVSGYSYNSQSCYACHPTGKGGD